MGRIPQLKPNEEEYRRTYFFPGEDEDEEIRFDPSKDNVKKRPEELPRAPKIFHSFSSDSQRMQKTVSTQKSVLAKSKSTKFLPNVPPNSQSHHTSNIPKRTHTHSDLSRRNHATADPLERSHTSPNQLQRFHTSCTSPNLFDKDCTPPDLLQRCRTFPDSRQRNGATAEPFQRSQTSSDPLRRSHTTADSFQRGCNSPDPLQRSHTAAHPFQRGQTSSDPLRRSHRTTEPFQKVHTSPDPIQRNHATADPFQRGHTSPDPLQRSCASPDLHQKGNVYHQPHGLLRPQAFLDTSLLCNIITHQEIMMDQIKIIYRTVQGLKSVSEEDLGLESNLLPVADLQSLQNLEEQLRNFPDFQKQLLNMLAMTPEMEFGE